MVFNLTIDPAGNGATLTRPGLRKGQEVFSLELDKEALEFLQEALRKAGITPPPVEPRAGEVRQNTNAPEGVRQNYAAPAAKPEAPFVPGYRAATITSVTGATYGLNPNYFATKETADWIAKKYGTGEVVESAFGGDGGPFAASDKELHIKLANGKTVNAGILAAYYDRNPESLFPGVADRLIQDLLKGLV